MTEPLSDLTPQSDAPSPLETEPRPPAEVQPASPETDAAQEQSPDSAPSPAELEAGEAPFTPQAGGRFQKWLGGLKGARGKGKEKSSDAPTMPLGDAELLSAEGEDDAEHDPDFDSRFDFIAQDRQELSEGDFSRPSYQPLSPPTCADPLDLEAAPDVLESIPEELPSSAEAVVEAASSDAEAVVEAASSDAETIKEVPPSDAQSEEELKLDDFLTGITPFSAPESPAQASPLDAESAVAEPPAEEAPPAPKAAGRLQKWLGGLKGARGKGKEKSSEVPPIPVEDAELMPRAAEDEGEQNLDFDSRFDFIVQDQQELSEGDFSRPSYQPVYPLGETDPLDLESTEEEPESLPKDQFLSGEENTSPSKAESEEELNDILTGITPFSTTGEPLDGPLPPSNKPFEGLDELPDEVPFGSPFAPAEELPAESSSEAENNFSHDELRAYLAELDDSDPQAPDSAAHSTAPDEKSEDWYAPLSTRPIISEEPEEESSFTPTPEDGRFDLRSLFGEEELAGAEPSGLDAIEQPDMPQSGITPPASTALFLESEEEEGDLINPKDFLPEGIFKDADSGVFVFDEESVQGESEKTSLDKSESDQDTSGTPVIDPFSRTAGSASYFDELRTALETEDDEERTAPHAPLIPSGDLGSVAKPVDRPQAEDTRRAREGREAPVPFGDFVEESGKPGRTPGTETKKAGAKHTGALSGFSRLNRKEGFLVGGAVLLGLVVFSIIAVMLLNTYLLPFLTSLNIPALPTLPPRGADSVAGGGPTVYPVSLKLPGGWVFSLQESTRQGENWQPVAAEYLPDATVRRVIAIPWSKQTEAVISTFVAGDELILFMSNNDVKGYKVEEVKSVPREDTAILVDNQPSLVVILSNPDAPTRWVVICKP